MKECYSLACSSGLSQLASQPSTTYPRVAPLHRGLGPPTPIIVKKMPSGLPIGQSGRGIFFFSPEIPSSEKALPSLSQVDKKKKKVTSTLLHSWWEPQSPGHMGNELGSAVQSHVHKHSQCPNNVPHDYLSKRNQSQVRRSLYANEISIKPLSQDSKQSKHPLMKG